MSKHGVFSGPYFPVFGLNTEMYGVKLLIQSKYGKIKTRKNSVFRHASHSERRKRKGKFRLLRRFFSQYTDRSKYYFVIFENLILTLKWLVQKVKKRKRTFKSITLFFPKPERHCVKMLNCTHLHLFAKYSSTVAHTQLPSFSKTNSNRCLLS